jgi:hypothetical protein
VSAADFGRSCRPVFTEDGFVDRLRDRDAARAHRRCPGAVTQVTDEDLRSIYRCLRTAAPASDRQQFAVSDRPHR